MLRNEVYEKKYFEVEYIIFKVIYIFVLFFFIGFWWVFRFIFNKLYLIFFVEIFVGVMGDGYYLIRWYGFVFYIF